MENPSYFTLALRYGLLFGTLIFCVDIGLWYAGWSTLENANSWTSWVLVALGIYLAADVFKRGNEGYARFAEIRKMSSWMGLFAGLLFGVAKTAQSVLDPSLSRQIFAVLENQLEKQNEIQAMPEESYDMVLGIYEKISSPAGLGIMGGVGVLLMFFLVGLVVGLIRKKDRDVFDPKSLDV